MFEFNPQIPYHRRMWHYESDRPLSVAQLVSLGSLDASTGALLWLLIEHHVSVIVSGPTDPTPGVGKTTTLNAMLDFLPAGSALVYTLGMYEDFAFRQEPGVDPATTCVLANEVSDHLRIYMWAGAARRLLRLPKDSYAIATSCHADTVEDVLRMLMGDLRLSPEDVGRLGVIINIGLVGRVWPPRRRFLTVNYVVPSDAQVPTVGSTPGSTGVGNVAVAGNLSGVYERQRAKVQLASIAAWDPASDTFVGPEATTLDLLAARVGMTPAAFRAAHERRAAVLADLAAEAQGHGVSRTAMRTAVHELQAAAQTEAGTGDGAPEHPSGDASLGAAEDAGD